MSEQDMFRTALADRTPAIHAALEAALSAQARPGEIMRPERLVAAMRHAVFNGGKRLRPFLTLETNALLGGDEAAALGVAAAIECIHCYSLVHDDLPAMDDDELRRGQPTVHVAYDEATAILAGDALLTLAFDLAGTGSEQLDAARRTRLVVAMARAAGPGGMAGGQMLDLVHETCPADAGTVSTIHAMKTGALIGFACEAGAIVAGREEERMRRYGAVVGLAFQLADDLLDVTADSAAMGKATGKDAGAGKKTLVGMHGVDWARARLDAYVEEAETLLAPFGARAGVLRGAARFIANRSS